MDSRLQAYLSGVRVSLPFAFGIFAFGLIFGVLAIDAGLSRFEALAMSLIVFAGSAQFIVIQLISEQVLGILIIFTGIIVNLRYILYASTLAPMMRGLSKRWIWILAYLLSDESFAITVMHYESTERTESTPWYLFGFTTFTWLAWVLATVAGGIVGAQIPSTWALDFVFPLAFTSLLVPAIKNKPLAIAAIVGGVVSVIAKPLPYQLGLIVAILCGIAAGQLSERFFPEGETPWHQ